VPVKPEDIIFPSLGIADDAAPDAAGSGGENGIVLRRFDRLKAEDFYVGSCLPLEMQARRDDPGIIEYHYGSLGKKIGDIAENEFVHDTIAIAKQFRSVTLRERVFCNPFIREGLTIVFYTYVRYHRENLKFDAKLHNKRQIRKTRGSYYGTLISVSDFKLSFHKRKFTRKPIRICKLQETDYKS
jgi:hypothetical protein